MYDSPQVKEEHLFKTLLHRSALSATMARYYNPNIGRFVSEDPFRFVDGPNFYAYVRNNSINRIDPEGLASFTNRSKYPIPYKPEGEDYNPPKLCMPGQTCDVDGVYSPPGSGKQCAVKIPNFCRAVVDEKGRLGVWCLFFFIEDGRPSGLEPKDFDKGDMQNWPDPFTGRKWPDDPWDPKLGCTCSGK